MESERVCGTMLPDNKNAAQNVQRFSDRYFYVQLPKHL